MLKGVARTGDRGRLSIPEIQGQHAGSWLALKDGVVVDAQPELDDLLSVLREHGIKDTTIIRAPDPNEPEPVGLG